MPLASFLNAALACTILGGLYAKLWRAASPLFIFANRYRFNTIASTIHGPVVEWILRMPPEH